MANYKILIKPSALKELDCLPKKIVQKLGKRIQSLSLDPRPQGVEKLSRAERYRIRQGNYRIVYAIDDSSKIVDVVKIAHRREVYR